MYPIHTFSVFAHFVLLSYKFCSWHISSSARHLKFCNIMLLRIIYWARLIHGEGRVSLSVSPKCHVKNIPGYLPCWCELCGTGQVLCLSRVKNVLLKVPPGEILTYVHIYYSCPMCLEGNVMQDSQVGLFLQNSDDSKVGLWSWIKYMHIISGFFLYHLFILRWMNVAKDMNKW